MTQLPTWKGNPPCEVTRFDTDESNDVTRRLEETIQHVDERLNEIDVDPEDPYDISIVVPVFNERETLPTILDRIGEVMPPRTETIVIDDASTDGTSQWLRTSIHRADTKIIHRLRNHGKGSAVRLGIRHSRGRVVAIQDADNEYDPISLIEVIRAVEEGVSDVVYGSRYIGDVADPSLIHRLGNWALTAASNCMSGQQLTDMETCHKAFRGDLIRSIALRECRFGFEPEITSKVSAQGIQIAEVPTSYRYRSYDEGKKITWKDGVSAIACMWRYRNSGWIKRAVRGLGRVVLRISSWLHKASSAGEK